MAEKGGFPQQPGVGPSNTGYMYPQPPPEYYQQPGPSGLAGMPSAPPTYEEACNGYARTFPQQNYSAPPNANWMPQSGYPVNNGFMPPNAQHFPVVHAEFDAGARFTAHAPPSIPPPPPGCPPNAAQMAASKGQSVVMGKKKEGFLNGSGSGGYTFW